MYYAVCHQWKCEFMRSPETQCYADQFPVIYLLLFTLSFNSPFPV